MFFILLRVLFWILVWHFIIITVVEALAHCVQSREGSPGDTITTTTTRTTTKGFSLLVPKNKSQKQKPPRRRHFRRRFILGWFLFLIVSSVWWFCVSFASSDVIMIVLALSHASPFVCPWAPLGFSQSNLFVILLQIFFPFFFFGSKSQAVSTPSRGHLCSRQNTSYVHSVFHLLIIHTAVCCHHSRSILHSGCSLHVHFQLFSSSSLMISKITVAFHICLHRSLVVR